MTPAIKDNIMSKDLTLDVLATNPNSQFINNIYYKLPNWFASMEAQRNFPLKKLNNDMNDIYDLFAAFQQSIKTFGDVANQPLMTIANTQNSAQDQRTGLDVLLDVLVKIRNNPSNPFDLYTNQDRFSNVIVRYYATYKGLKPDQTYMFNRFITYQQHFWTSTALIGLGVVVNQSINVKNALDRLGNNYNIDDLKEQIKDLQSLQNIVIARQVIAAMTHSVSTITNYFAWDEKTNLTPTAKIAWMTKLSQIRNGDPELPNGQYAATYKKLTLASFQDYENKIKQVKFGISASTFAMLTINGILAVGMNSKALILAYDLPAGSQRDNAIAAAALTLTSSIFNVGTNATKSIAALLAVDKVKDVFGISALEKELKNLKIAREAAVKLNYEETVAYKTIQIRALELKLTKFKANIYNYAGTVLGVMQAITSIASLAPLLFSNNLTSEQKAIVGAEMALQVGGGLGQMAFLKVLSSAVQSARILSSVRTATVVLGAIGIGAAASGLMALLSPLEIYGLVQQSKYADQLDQLQGEFDPKSGWLGDGMLADLYREKTTAEAILFGVSTTIAIIGTTVAIAFAATGIGALPGAIVSIVEGALSGILQGIRQPIIEKIATDYANKIQQEGGSFNYFSKNLIAQYDRYLKLPATVESLKNMQDIFGVDSVIGVTTVTISQTALELAAITRNTANLKADDSYINRFINGKITADRSLNVDLTVGTIDLTGKAGSKQLLTFLTPLKAPGEIKTTRIQTGKNEYFTKMDIVLSGRGWTITDSDASTIFDLRSIVSRVCDSDGNLKVNQDGKVVGDIDLKVIGGNGNDTVIANTSKINFDGGSGTNIIRYDSIDGLNGILVSPTKNGFTVTKSFDKVEVYAEVTRSQNYNYGKRTETVNYRDVEVKTIARISSIEDTLTNVQNIISTNLNDNIVGNSQNNYFQSKEGDDTLQGGDGNDTLEGGSGTDLISGDAGNDYIYQSVDATSESLNGGEGNDTVDYSAVNSPVFIENFYSNSGYQSEYSEGAGEGGHIWLLYATPNPSVWGFLNQYGRDGSQDQFLLVNGATVTNANNTHKFFWKKTVNLVSGVNYEFSYWINSGGTNNQAQIQLYQDSVKVGATYNAQMSSGWKEIKMNFQATKTGSVVLSLRDLLLETIGNDFAIDHIALTVIANSTNGINADLSTGQVIKYLDKVSVNDNLTNVENLIGTNLNDTLIGNAEDNNLSGDLGNDSLSGGAGGDHLNGGAGNDTLVGGEGDDTLIGGIGSDVINGGAGDDNIIQIGEWIQETLDGAEGRDRVDYIEASQILMNTENFDSDRAYQSDYTTWTVGTDYVNGSKWLTCKVPDWVGALNKNGKDGDLDQFLMVTGASDASKAFWKKTVSLIRGVTYEFSFWINSGVGVQARIQLYSGNTSLGNTYSAQASSGWQQIKISFVAIATGDVVLALKDLETSSDANDFAIDHIVLTYQLTNGINASLVTGKVYKYLGDLNQFDTLNNIENLRGTNLNDTLIGSAQDNELVGELGNDSISGGDGSDYLLGDDGADTLDGGSGDDLLSGGSGADQIDAGADNDHIVQIVEIGNDTINGGTGIDSVDYSLVNLTSRPIIFTENFDSNADYQSEYVATVGHEGYTSLTKLAESKWNFSKNIGRDEGADQFLLVDGSSDANKAFWEKTVSLIQGVTYEFSYWIISGSTAPAKIRLYQDNTALGSTYHQAQGNTNWTRVSVTFEASATGDAVLALKDLETAGVGNDFAIDHITLVGKIEGINASLSTGKVYKYSNNINLFDTITNVENLSGTNLNDTLVGNTYDNALTGGSGCDLISASDGDDTISGGEGDDTLNGGGQNDVLNGEAGADQINGESGNDIIFQNVELANNVINGGDGIDLVDYSQVDLYSMEVIFIENFDSDTGYQSEYTKWWKGSHTDINGNWIYINGAIWLDKTVPSWMGALNVNGKDGDADQFLMVTGANDASKAFWKKAVSLIQGVTYEFSYWINSGSGRQAKIQLYSDSNSLGATYTAKASSGWQKIQVSFVAATTGDVVLTMRDLETSGDANDFAIDHVALTAQQNGINANLSTGIVCKYLNNNGLYDTLSNIENLIGTNLNDVMTGSNVDNNLFGFLGDDLINGEGSDDLLSGGEGNDTLNGGAGDDVLSGGDGVDVISGGAGNDCIVLNLQLTSETLNGGEGIDTVDYSDDPSLLINEDFDSENDFDTDYINKQDGSSGSIWLTKLAGSNWGLKKMQGKDGRADQFLMVNGASDANKAFWKNTVSLIQGVTYNFSYWINSGISQQAQIRLYQGSDAIDNTYTATATSGWTNVSISFVAIATGDVVLSLKDIESAVVGNDFAIDHIALYTQQSGLGINANLSTGTVVKRVNGISSSDTLIDIENVTGTMLNDTLIGNLQNNALSGGLGNDSIDGGDGNDALSGGMGADFVNGGSGDDLISQHFEALSDTLDGGDGIDTVDYSASTLPWLIMDNFSTDNEFQSDYSITLLPSTDGSVWFTKRVDPIFGLKSSEGRDGSDDQFLMVNGGDSTKAFWKQTVSLIQETTYEFSYWINSGGDTQAQIQLYLGSSKIGDTYQAQVSSGWQQVTVSFTAEITGEFVVALKDLISTNAKGNDFAIDHISLTPQIKGIYADLNLASGVVQKYMNNQYTEDRLRNIENIVGTYADDILRGNGLGNILSGGLGEDEIYGFDGNDTLNGGDGDDSLIGGKGNDLLEGGSGIDNINGNEGNDIIVQDIGSDNDIINGGDGNDTLDYSSNKSLVSVSSGIRVNLTTGYAYKFTNNTKIYDSLSNIENVIGTYLSDTLTGSASDNQFSGGDGADSVDGMVGNDVLMGDNGADTLNGGDGDDIVVGGNGADAINGGAGNDMIIQGIESINDVIDGGTGSDTVDYQSSTLASGISVDLIKGKTSNISNNNTIYDSLKNIENVIGTNQNDNLIGNEQDNVLTGGLGDDTITGGSGNDLLKGGDGNDTLTDTSGKALFWAGSGNDVMTGGSGIELFIGSTDNDTITTSLGSDIIAFNKLDGVDTVVADNTQDNILSIGGGVKYSDLYFAKSGANLELQTNGATNKVILKDWYSTSAAKKSVLTLQMIVEASTDYNASSTDSKYNKKIASFNFKTLVQNFDSALTTTPSLSTWALSNALTSAYLNGSDNQVLGGDLAYQYGRFGSLSNVGYLGAQTVLMSSSFGARQTLQSSSALSAGVQLDPLLQSA